MKNPWMSLWLSAANKAAGPARGLWMAEAQRMQRSFAKDAAKSLGLAATGSRRKPETKRRAK